MSTARSEQIEEWRRKVKDHGRLCQCQVLAKNWGHMVHLDGSSLLKKPTRVGQSSPACSVWHDADEDA